MTAPLTEDGRPMKLVPLLGGWCDPECDYCNGTGIDSHEIGERFACPECFLDGREVLTARDYCPPMGEAR